MGSEKLKIRNTYEVSDVYEVQVDYEPCSYLIIYGHHINGWFIAIPNHEVSVEAGEPQNTYYNGGKLGFVFDNEEVGRKLAEAIRVHYLLLKRGEIEA